MLKKKSIEEEIPIYKELSITYAKLNDFNKAYEFLNLHNQYKEQLLADNNAQQLKKIEFNFQLKAITSETEETKRKIRNLLRLLIKLSNNEMKLNIKT